MRSPRTSSVLSLLFTTIVGASGVGCDTGDDGTGGAGGTGSTSGETSSTAATTTSAATTSSSSGGSCSPEVCGNAIDEDCDGVASACGVGDVLFIGAGDAWLASVAYDASGSTYLGGFFNGELTVGGVTLTSPSGDAFVAKLAPDGHAAWAKRFGDGSGSDVYRVSVDADGNVVLALDLYGSADFGGGTLTSAGNADLAIVKLDADGAHVWSKRFGDAEDQAAWTMELAANGDVVVSGGFRGTLDFGDGALTSAGLGDVYVARLSAAGATLWSDRFGSATNNEAAFDMAVDRTGATILVGPFDGDTDFGDGVVTNQGLGDVFVTKLDADGKHVFTRTFADQEVQWATAVGVGPSNEIVVAGTFKGTLDFGGPTGPVTAVDEDAFVVSLSSAGETAWRTTLSAPGVQSINDVRVDAQGRVFLGGQSDEPFDAGGGALGTVGVASGFLLVLDTKGAHLASEGMTSTGTTSVDCVALTNGGILFGGGADTSAEIGGQSLGAPDGHGFFVAPFYL